MSEEQNKVAFTAAELSAIDTVISHLQTQGVAANEVVPLFTPVAGIVANAVLSTAAVLCVKVPEDEAKIKQIEEIAKSLQTTTTLANLIELRSRAVQASSAEIISKRN